MRPEGIAACLLSVCAGKGGADRPHSPCRNRCVHVVCVGWGQMETSHSGQDPICPARFVTVSIPMPSHSHWSVYRHICTCMSAMPDRLHVRLTRRHGHKQGHNQPCRPSCCPCDHYVTRVRCIHTLGLCAAHRCLSRCAGMCYCAGPGCHRSTQTTFKV